MKQCDFFQQFSKQEVNIDKLTCLTQHIASYFFVLPMKIVPNKGQNELLELMIQCLTFKNCHLLPPTGVRM